MNPSKNRQRGKATERAIAKRLGGGDPSRDSGRA